MKKCTLTLLTLFGITPVLISCVGTTTRYGEKGFGSYRVLKIADTSGFVRINSFNYPSGNFNYNIRYNNHTVEYHNAIDNFSNTIFKNIDDSSNEGFSPIALYALLNELSYASTSDELTNSFDNLLGLNKVNRKEFYKTVFKNNFFANDNGSIYLYNGAFLSNQFTYSQSFVDELAQTYCEAYSMNFLNNEAVNKLYYWVCGASDMLIPKSELQFDEFTMFYLISTMLFNNGWESKYESTYNYEDTFFESSTKSYPVTYMRHKYSTEGLYDYGEYLSFRDFYNNKCSVTYLVPKDTSKSIIDLIKDVNIFVDDESKFVRGEKFETSYSEEYERVAIDLSLPKFQHTTSFDLIPVIRRAGLGDIFDTNKDSFSNMFTDCHENVYVKKMKQYNDVSFEENGTVIKSAATASGDMAAAPIDDVYEIKLNQPFVYIIRDGADIPLYVGYANSIQKE